MKLEIKNPIFTQSKLSLGEKDTKSFSKEKYLLLEWAAANPDLIGNVKEKIIKIPERNFYSFSAEIHDPIAESSFIGVGRAHDRLNASSKAIGECLERYFAKYIFSTQPKLIGTTIVVKGKEVSFQDVNNFTFPLSGLRSSNGWAVHFSPEMALAQSLFEALERHILLFTFLRDGWDGFVYYDGPEYNKIDFSSLISKYSVAEFKAGISIAKVQNYSGILMGYCSDLCDKIAASTEWLQAFFEVYENAVIYSNPDTNTNGQMAKESSLLLDYLHHFLRTPSPSFKRTANSNQITQKTQEITTQVLLLDLSSNFNFPFYATYVCGIDLIPLFFSQNLDPAARTHIQGILKKKGLSGEIPFYHPII